MVLHSAQLASAQVHAAIEALQELVAAHKLAAAQALAGSAPPRHGGVVLFAEGALLQRQALAMCGVPTKAHDRSLLFASSPDSEETLSRIIANAAALPPPGTGGSSSPAGRAIDSDITQKVRSSK